MSARHRQPAMIIPGGAGQRLATGGPARKLGTRPRSPRSWGGRLLAVAAVAVTVVLAGPHPVDASADTTYSLFTSADTSSARTVSDSSVELGVRVTASVSGQIAAVRFLKASGDGSRHEVTVWSSSGTRLASAWSSNEGPSGWQEVSLPSPVPVAGGSTFVVSYHTSTYMATNDYFSSKSVNGPLTAESGNGVYGYGDTPLFPARVYMNTNYWVDPVYVASAGAPAAYACTTSATTGRCGPYPGYSQVRGASSDPTVDQNMWATQAGYTQTLHANGPGDWYVTANGNVGNGAVLSYPNTGFQMQGKVDDYTSITSSFSHAFPHNAQTAGWAAYDLWLNDWGNEVMVQTDISANSDYYCSIAASATFNGDPWHLCIWGNQRIWKHGTDEAHLINQSSGTLDIKAMLVWLEQHGQLPAGSTWSGASYGFEVCQTGGVDATFQVNGFSWTAS
jgi:hypothetical protein